MATIKIEIKDQLLWETVFGSSPFSFGDHFTAVKYLGKATWETLGKIKITGLNEKDEEVTKILSVKDLANALPIANNQVYMDLLDFEEYDSICSDSILQVAMFGKVIYG